MGGEELHPDEEGPPGESLLGIGPKRDLPAAEHSRRHDLLPGLDHLLDLLADEGWVEGGGGGVLEALFEEGLDVLGEIDCGFPGPGAGHQDFVAQFDLLLGREFAGAQLEQAVSHRSRHGQHAQIDGHDADPLAQPDLPAGNGLGRDEEELHFLDVAGQRSTGDPERGEPEQGCDGAEGVGDEDLGETLGRAVMLDGAGQDEHQGDEQTQESDDQAVAEGGLDGQQGHREQWPQWFGNQIRDSGQIASLPLRQRNSTDLKNLGHRIGGVAGGNGAEVGVALAFRRHFPESPGRKTNHDALNHLAQQVRFPSGPIGIQDCAADQVEDQEHDSELGQPEPERPDPVECRRRPRETQGEGHQLPVGAAVNLKATGHGGSLFVAFAALAAEQTREGVVGFGEVDGLRRFGDNGCRWG